MAIQQNMKRKSKNHAGTPVVKNVKKKQYKMVSINYTNNCAKFPRCSFCYLTKAKVFQKLKEGKKVRNNYWSWIPALEKLLDVTEQVAIAYNGLELKMFIDLLETCTSHKRLIVNITTNPLFINQAIVALFKRYKVKMVALSLDSEKCNVKEWIKKARLLRKKLIQVGANILMLDEVYYQLPSILKKIKGYCGQIHLLRPKFYKTKIPLKKRKEMIFLLKQQYPKLFIDQCFKFEFQNIPCTRGKEFISLNANGILSLCSFDIYQDNKKNLKKCPYI